MLYLIISSLFILLYDHIISHHVVFYMGVSMTQECPCYKVSTRKGVLSTTGGA